MGSGAGAGAGAARAEGPSRRAPLPLGARARLEQLIGATGLSGRRFAAAAGLPETEISLLLTGKRTATAAKLLAIRDALNRYLPAPVSLDALLTGVAPLPPPPALAAPDREARLRLEAEAVRAGLALAVTRTRLDGDTDATRALWRAAEDGLGRLRQEALAARVEPSVD